MHMDLILIHQKFFFLFGRMIVGMCRMWGTLLADLVIQMLETDYARILRAIYAFAQVLISYVGNSSSCTSYCSKSVKGLFV